VDLEYLRVDGNLVTLDLARFRRLRDVDLVWHSKLGLTPDCTALRRVLLRKYKSRSRSLDELPVLPELHDLALVQGHLESLEGVAKFRALRRLELSYLRRLTSLGPLAAVRDGALEQLECYRCPRLEDHAVVSQLPSLRVLRFIGCGRIASLGFVNAMPALEELRFVDSNVVDGDMSPCLRLKRVGFNNKRHYSHTLLKVLTHIGGPELESYVRTMRDLTSIRAAGREARELG
jgi:hypothetical protein